LGHSADPISTDLSFLLQHILAQVFYLFEWAVGKGRGVYGRRGKCYAQTQEKTTFLVHPSDANAWQAYIAKDSRMVAFSLFIGRGGPLAETDVLLP